MKLTEAQHDSCINQVDGGTSDSIEDLYRDLLEELGIDWETLDAEDHGYIDDRIFNCEQCNWTQPIDNMAETDDPNDWICEECNEENS